MSLSPPGSIRLLIARIILIVSMSGLLAVAVNRVHPGRIEWIQDWDSYVEARAAEAQIEVIPLSLARSLHQRKDGLFVDARPATEFARSHIPNALCLPVEEIDSRFSALEQALDSEHPLIVYCQNRMCDDALVLALELRDMGQSNLLYYVDGLEMWEEAGCPLETP